MIMAVASMWQTWTLLRRRMTTTTRNVLITRETEIERANWTREMITSAGSLGSLPLPPTGGELGPSEMTSSLRLLNRFWMSSGDLVVGS